MIIEPTWYSFLVCVAPGNQQQTDEQYQCSGCHGDARRSHCSGIRGHGDQVCLYGAQTHRSHRLFASRDQIHEKSDLKQPAHDCTNATTAVSDEKLPQQSGLFLYMWSELVTSQVRVMQKSQHRREMVNNTLVTLRGWIRACALECTGLSSVGSSWVVFDSLVMRSKFCSSFEHQKNLIGNPTNEHLACENKGESVLLLLLLLL